MKRILVLLLLSAIALPLFATGPAGEYFKDVILTDQNGHRVRLYEDVIKDRTIVMNSFFATCKGACPIMTQTYTSLQDRFAEHLGKDLMFVSITVDPTAIPWLLLSTLSPLAGPGGPCHRRVTPA